jgi:hypothetical protein
VCVFHILSLSLSCTDDLWLECAITKRLLKQRLDLVGCFVGSVQFYQL